MGRARTSILSAALASACLCLPAAAQDNPHNVPREESAFIEQAPEQVPEVRQVQAQPQDAGSPVYFPDQITPQTVAAARARQAEQEQLSRGEGARDVDQLSNRESAEALAQLSDAEREVLLDAVEGTDICDRSQNIPALQALCENRLETRSAEFAQRSERATAEGAILGEDLDTNRAATLQVAITRLAQNVGRPDDFSNQVIASVSLGSQTLGSAEASEAEGDGSEDLSQETQALIAAIVQQFGGN